jgi:hypothetical protein
MKEELKMWFDGENKPFNAKFINNNMPVREILI